MHNKKYILPVLYLGCKYSLLDWLLPHLETPHVHFVDLFGGSATVLVNKPVSKVETYNDINSNIVNFFRVLRQNSQELITSLELTPYSREEYESADCSDDITDIERARRFFIRLRQSIMASGGQNETKGWASTLNTSRVGMSEAVSKYLGNIQMLPAVYARLRSVQIENRDYLWVLMAYASETTLFYCDPPYDMAKRSSGSDYEFDFPDYKHIALAGALHLCKGKVAISGYNTDFMMDLYKDFKFHLGPERKNPKSNKINVRECLWTNY